jgi:hypothetical protein
MLDKTLTGRRERRYYATDRSNDDIKSVDIKDVRIIHHDGYSMLLALDVGVVLKSRKCRTSCMALKRHA